MPIKMKNICLKMLLGMYLVIVQSYNSNLNEL